MTAMKRCHPDIFERLADLGEPRYLIDPVDLPFVFLLRPDPEAPTLTAASDAEGFEATAAIRGPLLALIDLLSDVLSVLGPFSGPARVLAGGVTALFSRAAQDLETLRTAIIAPAIRRMDAGLRELDEEVSALKRQVPRGKGRRP